jgi:hypothetical protein
MFVDSTRRRTGAGANQDEEVEYRRDSTSAGGFLDNLFGGGTMRRGDAEEAAVEGGRARSEFGGAGAAALLAGAGFNLILPNWGRVQAASKSSSARANQAITARVEK